MLVTFRRSNARLEPYIAFALASLGFFFAQALLSVWHMHRVMTAPTQEALINQIATWQAPLRDLQIHGLALFMILGVSLRMLPALYEVPRIADRRAWIAFALLLAAVVGEAAVFVIYRLTGLHALAALLLLPWLMLAAGCALVALPWQFWRPLVQPDGTTDRTAKFIRIAWGWLAVSLVMLLLLPVYQLASGIPFSHAYYGAIRHAITVGFVSLMIMGYAARVAPTLDGVDTRRLPALWIPFWLVNIGCFLRVSTQTLTDWHPAFFAVIGISGTLEVTGLAVWGVHLARIMLRSRNPSTRADDTTPPELIAPEHTPAQVYEWFPQTLDVFEQYGLGVIRNPMLRNTVARHITLAQVTAMHDIPLAALLRDLNRAARRLPASDCTGCESTCGAP